jgi:hypothetical protein
VEVYTLCPDNGGSSGEGYSAQLFTLRLRGPFGAGVRAGFSPDYRSLSAISTRTRPLQSLCFFCLHGLYAIGEICQANLGYCHLNFKSGLFKLEK